MHVQFDPRNLQPLGDAGTVYPNLRISDDWGTLDAKNGALLKPDWNAVIVVAPSVSTGFVAHGRTARALHVNAYSRQIGEDRLTK
jgi:hypothetical protein